jgi:hypothetical protein
MTKRRKLTTGFGAFGALLGGSAVLLLGRRAGTAATFEVAA